jgi:hypothetical protein
MKKLLIIIAAMTLTVSAASGAVLWDQSATRPDLAGFWNSDSPGMFGGGQIFGASDITLATGSRITTITTYYTNTGAWAPGVYAAWFDIYPKTGPTPVTGTDDPLVAANVNVTIADIGNQVLSVTLSGLNEELAPGDYWVLLSPVAPQGFIGVPEFQIFFDGPVMGDPSCQIEFGGFFAPVWAPNGDALDGSILIEGDMDVVATEAASFGGVKSLYR